MTFDISRLHFRGHELPDMEFHSGETKITEDSTLDEINDEIHTVEDEKASLQDKINDYLHELSRLKDVLDAFHEYEEGLEEIRETVEQREENHLSDCVSCGKTCTKDELNEDILCPDCAEEEEGRIN